MEDRKTLQVPSAADGLQIGLNMFGAKLLAESWPHALELLGKLELPADSRVSMVLEAKNKIRVRITLETTEEPLTPGQAAL